jgi:hypothetical protein
MEERPVAILEFGVLIFTLLAAVVGIWSIYWVRVRPHCWRGRGGRILFIVNFLALGAIGLVAAFTRAQGLSPLGLVAGLLVVGMLWEGPAIERRSA